jgi:ABC-type multidrug transport system ATPase subunit
MPRGAPGTVVIELREVSKRFGDRVALDGVSIDVQPGTVHVLLGSSGSGKSTVLRVVLGLVAPDEGQVRVDGTPVNEATRATSSRAWAMWCRTAASIRISPPSTTSPSPPR